MTTLSSSRAFAIAALVGALVLACADGEARPKRKGKSMTFDEAVALLQQPKRWCDGAAALGKLGDRRAIAPLYGVVALSGEGLPDRACVRAALEKLGVRDEAKLLVAAAEVGSRRTGVGMLKAFPADEDAAILSGLALRDADASIRMLAARALRTHKTSAAWDAAMITLLDAPDPPVRVLAAGSLERRFSADVLAALRARAGTESEPAVQTALAAAIKLHEEHAQH